MTESIIKKEPEDEDPYERLTLEDGNRLIEVELELSFFSGNAEMKRDTHLLMAGDELLVDEAALGFKTTGPGGETVEGKLPLDGMKIRVKDLRIVTLPPEE